MRKRSLMEELNIMITRAMRQKFLKMFQGRPVREEVINEDDIINLKIALHVSTSLEEFLNNV